MTVSTLIVMETVIILIEHAVEWFCLNRMEIVHKWLKATVPTDYDESVSNEGGPRLVPDHAMTIVETACSLTSEVRLQFIHDESLNHVNAFISGNSVAVRNLNLVPLLFWNGQSTDSLMLLPAAKLIQKVQLSTHSREASFPDEVCSSCSKRLRPLTHHYLNFCTFTSSPSPLFTLILTLIKI